jgi:hypothetical protein
MVNKTLKKLDSSVLDRKNILNNPYALEFIKKEVGIKSSKFENEYIFTAKQIAIFFEVDEKTIDRYIAKYSKELIDNGYQVLSGERLQSLKNTLRDIDVPKNTPKLGIFNFRAFINIAMLLAESEKARVLRGFILDIVIDVVSAKAGGSTKYINQRDEEYLLTLYAGEGYKKEFVEALKKYVDMGHIKHAIYTDKIYQSIFKERAKEYRIILKLSQKENVRNTMYSEVLTTISMYETGLAHEIKKKYEQVNRKLSSEEVDELFKEFEKNPAWVPQVETVRRKMASRDYGLRSITHPELIDYINPLDATEFERFLGKKSKELAVRIKEYQNVFKRLKDK